MSGTGLGMSQSSNASGPPNDLSLNAFIAHPRFAKNGQIVAAVAVLAARRLDEHGQIPAQLVLFAYLGLEPEDDEIGA